VFVVLFQTLLPNGAYEQHSVKESSVVFTSYNGIFRVEVPYNNLYYSSCISAISYEFMPASDSCVGKSLRGAYKMQ